MINVILKNESKYFNDQKLSKSIIEELAEYLLILKEDNFLYCAKLPPILYYYSSTIDRQPAIVKNTVIAITVLLNLQYKYLSLRK